MEKESDQTGDQGDGEVGPVLYRCRRGDAEEEVAHDPTTDTRGRTHRENAPQVKILADADQCARAGEHCHAGVVQDVLQHRRLPVFDLCGPDESPRFPGHPLDTTKD